ncbi:hypothetical protein [Actinomyces naeslundii]
MKPQPRRRAVSIPKATGPDPAALTAGQAANASIASNDGNRDNGGNDSVAGDTDASVLKKITVRIPAELAGRARSVWRLESAQPDTPFRAYHELIADWIEAGVTEAEERLNGGQPLPPTPAGQIPRGRQPQ